MIRSKKFRGMAARCAMVAALAGVGAGVLGMGPGEGWGGRDGRRGGHDRREDRGGWGWPVVVVRPPVIVIGREERRCEVAPMSVTVQAYQSRDRVIVLVNGMNGGEGFCTEVAGVERCWGEAPTVVVRNVGPDCRRGCATGFSVNAGFASECALSTVRVRIGGAVYVAAVTWVGDAG